MHIRPNTLNAIAMISCIFSFLTAMDRSQEKIKENIPNAHIRDCATPIKRKTLCDQNISDARFVQVDYIVRYTPDEKKYQILHSSRDIAVLDWHKILQGNYCKATIGNALEPYSFLVIGTHQKSVLSYVYWQLCKDTK